MTKFKIGDAIILSNNHLRAIPRVILDVYLNKYLLQVQNKVLREYEMDIDYIDNNYRKYIEFNTPLYKLLKETEEEDADG